VDDSVSLVCSMDREGDSPNHNCRGEEDEEIVANGMAHLSMSVSLILRSR
jgi:hypothetical protein